MEIKAVTGKVAGIAISEADTKALALPALPKGAIDRRYKIDQLIGRKVDPSEAEGYKGCWTLASCPQCAKSSSCPEQTLKIASLIIGVDGTCSTTGGSDAKASVGVFVGPGNKFNRSFVLDDHYKQTSQVAELRACTQALAIVIRLKSKKHSINGKELVRVVIKSHSEYLVKGITEWIFKWEANDCKTCTGKPVANIELFKKMMDQTKRLEKLGVRVFFWQVPRSANTYAETLAKQVITWPK
jgi:ribonuclease HI